MALYLLSLLAIFFVSLASYILFTRKNYWKVRNVKYVQPLPVFGNYKDYLLLKNHQMLVAQEICKQFPKEPYFGTFYGTDPALMIQDPTLLKAVMTKDFYFCNGREAVDYCDKETLTKNMFFQSGDYWKVLRTNLTPLFTSTKLKNMFYLIKDCADTLENLLETDLKTNAQSDKRRLLSKYTMDCITACAFGVKSESMKDNNDANIFTVIGDKIFDSSRYRGAKVAARSMWPRLFYALNFKMFEDAIGNFFTSLLIDIFRSREAQKSSKNDFVDLVLAWKTGQCISGDSIDNVKTNDKKIVSIKVNDELLVAQCVLFFAAGFETTATTASFLLYELAKNQDAQNKLIKEVDEYYEKYKEIEYECINRMPYTEACLSESLRLYPVIGLITREVMHDYTLPTGLQLQKGLRIHIPAYHIHHNPDFFPKPEVFRPERFLGEEKNNIIPYTYMPFGEGPRICIGMRFAKLPIYAALLKIFKNYRVELADDMPMKITVNPTSIVTQSIDGIRLKLIPRKA